MGPDSSRFIAPSQLLTGTLRLARELTLAPGPLQFPSPRSCLVDVDGALEVVLRSVLKGFLLSSRGGEPLLTPRYSRLSRGLPALAAQVPFHFSQVGTC